MNNFGARRSGWSRIALSRELVVLAAMLTAMQANTAECLRYGQVTLTGTLVRQTYPGPPDYESVTKGDEPRVILVVLLEQGVCVSSSDSVHPSAYFEREIQLAGGSDELERYKPLLGKKIEVSGELLPGRAGDDKRLVLRVSEMRQIGR